MNAATGATGPTGDIGLTGATGAAGETGPAGVAGVGSIIPFSSGIQITLTTDAFGNTTSAAAPGFGYAESFAFSTNPIDASILQYCPAFIVPRDGTITESAAYFSVSQPYELGDTVVTITSELYQSTMPNNVFTLILGSGITLSPSFSGSTPVGTRAYGKATSLSIPVSADTRLMPVVKIFAANAAGALSINGFISGGITIE